MSIPKVRDIIKKIDPLPVARKLLRLQREQADPRLLHLALDLLGVPPHTDAFSRDFCLDVYAVMGVNDIDGFIDIVTGKLVLCFGRTPSNWQEALARVSVAFHEQQARRRALSKPRYLPSPAEQRALRLARSNTVHERRSFLTSSIQPKEK